MDRHRSNVSLILYRISLIGLAIVPLTVFFFLTKSAEMQSLSDSSERTLAVGKLAYATQTLTVGNPIAGIATANADGTGAVTLTNFPPVSEPSWSPDGTKIVYLSFGSNAEIFVMNADGSNKTNLSNSSSFEGNPSWSVTGKIVYERDNQIWTMSEDGSNQTPFTAITQPAPTDPAWSPDGSKLAFVSDGEIWKINADGTNQQRVTTNSTIDADPSWSHDGAKIVFGKGGVGIAVVNADGTNETNLTTNPGDARPAWSPDGTTIAFRRDATLDGIFLMDASGGNQVRIIADVPGSRGTINDIPAWQPVPLTPNTFIISGRITNVNVGMPGVTVNLSGSTNAVATTDALGNYQFAGLAPGGNYTISPSFLNHYFTPPNRSFVNLNGNKIADFAATKVCTNTICVQNGKIAYAAGANIWTMNYDGSDPAPVTNNGAGFADAPNYSPDGSTIVYQTSRDGNNEIYKINSIGANQTRLTNNTAADTEPYYSPSGASIVFVSNRDGNNEIYKMNADGSNQVRLTNDAGSDTSPAFSPDGQKIIFVTTRLGNSSSLRLFTMNADGSNQQVISDVAGYYNRPSYSPDGQKIIFSYGTDIMTVRLWTMNADGSNRQQIPVGMLSPSYSPDGTKILYFFGSGGTIVDGIYTANADGSSQKQISNFSSYVTDWQPLIVPRRTAFDFDGDARSDVSVFRPADRVWYLLGSQTGNAGYQWGLSSDTIVPADYDGDLKTDVAVWRASDGNFYILNSFNNTVRIENFGLSGDIPTGGDFDGDSKADLAIYRGGAQGVFYYRASMGNPSGNITVIPWGISGDKAVASDYDGDGRTDAAIYRPSNGGWYIRKSSDGQLSATGFGLAGDTLIPADYDGDGKTDLAVFRSGIWYVLRSSQGSLTFQYGLKNDIPVPADYDGDGRADAAIYRDGAWWIWETQSGTTKITNFGIGGDLPVPAAYVR